MTRLVSRRPDLSHACSLWSNNIGDKGAAALAAILKETQISDLKCAATLSVFAFVSAPVDMPQPPPLCSHSRSISRNSLGPEGGAALAEGLKGNSTLQSLE